MKIAPVTGMLMAGFPTRLRWLVGFFLFSVIGWPLLLMALFNSSAPAAPVMEKSVVVDIWLAWSLFAYGSRALLGDARTLRIPGVAKAWVATCLLFVLLSVLLPAMVFGLLLNGIVDSLPLFVCAAAIGMLLELMMDFPKVAGAFVVFVFLVTDWLKKHPPSAALASTWQDDPILSGLITPWTLSAIVCGLACWRWRRVILRTEGKGPTLLEALGGRRDGGISNANNVYRESRIVGAGRNWRVLAMRYWLGAPVAPIRRKTLALNVGVVLALLGFLMWQTQLAVAPLVMAVALAVIVPLRFSLQFRKRYVADGGELSDLALLPGWGDRETTQRTLLTAVFRLPAIAWIGAFTVIQALASVDRLGAAPRWSLACGMVVIGSGAATYCMKVLARRPPGFALTVYLYFLLNVVLCLSLLACIGFNWVDLRIWFAATATHGAVMAVLARSAYAEFRRQPHPFLAESDTERKARGASSLNPLRGVLVALLFVSLAMGTLGEAMKQYNERKVRAQEAARVVEAHRLSGTIIPGPTYRSAMASGGQGPEMVILPTGAFEMGSPDYERDRSPDEGPVHLVHIRRFALGKTALTRGDFAQFVAATGYVTDAEKNTGAPRVGRLVGCFAYQGGTRFGWKAGTSWRDPGYQQDDSHPAVCLSWNDAQAYAQWLSHETGKHYRLPTESEMEYAIRAGSSALYPWGTDSEQACRYGNIGDATWKARSPASTTTYCSDGFAFTAPVGHFRANAFGLLDTVGNSVTWTQDCATNSYANAPTDGSAQRNVGCESRVLRGSAWGYTCAGFRSAARRWIPPAGRDGGTGLRLAQDL